jgi:hypothetical protein
MKYFCAPSVRAALLLPLIASFTSPVRLRSVPHNSGRTAQTTESHLDEDSVQLTVTVTDKKGNYIGVDKADGKWHQLKLKLTPPPNAPPSMSKLLVRGREGYYAAKRVP